MYPYVKRIAVASFAIATMFWVGCSKGGSKDETPATTQLYQAYKACKARTGGQSLMYAMCYNQQDAYTNCDCVTDMQAQSIAQFKQSSGGAQQQYNPYAMNGMNGDETIINSYISYLNQTPADTKKRMIENWNKIGAAGGGQYGQQYGQQPYNPYGQQQQYQQQYQSCDYRTGMCWY